MTQVVFDGMRNPVLAAKAFCDAVGYPVDTASFDRVASIRGDRPIEDGFIVRCFEDVQRLCEIGNFVILQQDGQVIAMLPEEYLSGDAS